MPKIDKDCGVCTALLKACKKLGDRSFCKKTIKQLEDDKITESQLDRKLREHFGAKKFNKAWDKELEED